MKMSANLFNRSFFLAAAPAALFLAGCGNDKNSPAPAVEQAKVVFVNAASHIAPVNLKFSVDNSEKAALDYGKSSAYQTITSGSRPLQVAAGTQVALSQPLVTEKDKNYSFFAAPAGSSTSVGALLVPDDLTAPATGKARIRVVHLGQGVATPIRLSQTTAVTGAGVIVNDVVAGSASAFTEFNPGNYSLFISNTANAPLVQVGDGSGSGTGTKAYEAGKLYTVLVTGTSGSLNQDQKLKAFVSQNN